MRRVALVIVALAGAPSPGALPPARAQEASAPTWTKDVAPIVFRNCAACHRPGEVAPFSLLTYGDAAKRAKQISLSVTTRLMPPWRAEPGHGEFKDERRLSDGDIATIKKWVDAGCPEGKAEHLPAAPKFPDGWTLGEPDLVVKMKEPYTVRAEGRDIYRNFVVPLDLREDRVVRAIEYRPGNRRVVHHMLMFVDATGDARRRDEKDKEPGFPGFGAGLTRVVQVWAPGSLPKPLPDGVGLTLEKGSDLVLQLHFHPTGKEEEEVSTIGLYFAKDEPKKTFVTLPVASRGLDIPAGEKAHVVTHSVPVPIDLEIFGILPHAHLLGREIRVWAVLPDSTEKPLIWIRDWSFDWQEQYQYREPVKLPRGSRVHTRFVYDNSEGNINNPSSPPKRVRWGEQTTDEMALVLFQAVVPGRLADVLKRWKDRDK